MSARGWVILWTWAAMLHGANLAHALDHEWPRHRTAAVLSAAMLALSFWMMRYNARRDRRPVADGAR